MVHLASSKGNPVVLTIGKFIILQGKSRGSPLTQHLPVVRESWDLLNAAGPPPHASIIPERSGCRLTSAPLGVKAGTHLHGSLLGGAPGNPSLPQPPASVT